MQNLLQRVLTALVLGPLVLYIMWSYSPYGFFAIAFLAMLVGTWEYSTITMQDQSTKRRIAMLGCTALLSLTEFYRFCATPQQTAMLPSTGLILSLLFLFLALIFLFAPHEIEDAPKRLALSMLGVVYCGLLFTYVSAVGTLGAGPAWVTLLLTINWSSDTAGYFAGRFLGGKIIKRKLYEKISPKKTWEGFFAGILGSIGAVALAKVWYFSAGYASGTGPELTWLDCILLGVPAGALGVCGDLVESLLKRAYHVKDSGTILPGHGGILDRVDAVLFAAPYVYLYGKYLVDMH